MTMEIVEGQRFPKQFVLAVVAAGAIVVLFAAFCLPVAKLGLPLLLLVLFAAPAPALFDAPAAERDQRHFPFAEGFVFLATLLFDGEAAVLMAAAVALCASRGDSKGFYGDCFRAA